MKTTAIAVLCCPACRGDLRLKDAAGSAGAEVTQGTLECVACGKNYPIVRGVPRFVDSDAYVGNFSLEWTRHHQTQLDSATNSESEETFATKTGLRPADLNGKLVLDVGCGMGRFSDVATRWGATVVGIDLSLAVESAYANLGDRPNFHVVQANVLSLPFRPETFDIIFSIGVLHHTPNTEQAFRKLPSLLKPGGALAIWVYDAYNPFNRITDFYRRFTTRMPLNTLYAICRLAGPAYPLYRSRFFGRPFRVLLPMSFHPDPSWRILDTFDWYSPKYQWKHTYPELFEWFRSEGFEDMVPLDYPVAMSGRKRLDPGENQGA